MKTNTYTFTSNYNSKRLDILLVEYFEDIGDVFSRNAIQVLIKDGLVKVNGELSKPSRVIKLGDLIQISIPEQAPLDIKSQNIPLRIVYEDDNIVVINKKAGMVVHPAPGNEDGTLVNALYHFCGGKLSSIGGASRAGIVHRLDKDTSGLIVVAKDDVSHLDLAKQFSNKSAGRIYYAVVWGVPKEQELEISTFYGRHPADRKKFSSKLKSGKKAITRYKVVSHNDSFSLLRLELSTGRTHQIRVHMADLGHPLLGDITYGKQKDKKKFIDRQALHALSLTFQHPTNDIKLTFISPMEKDLKELINEQGL